MDFSIFDTPFPSDKNDFLFHIRKIKKKVDCFSYITQDQKQFLKNLYHQANYHPDLSKEEKDSIKRRIKVLLLKAKPAPYSI